MLALASRMACCLSGEAVFGPASSLGPCLCCCCLPVLLSLRAARRWFALSALLAPARRCHDVASMPACWLRVVREKFLVQQYAPVRNGKKRCRTTHGRSSGRCAAAALAARVRPRSPAPRRLRSGAPAGLGRMYACGDLRTARRCAAPALSAPRRRRRMVPIILALWGRGQGCREDAVQRCWRC